MSLRAAYESLALLLVVCAYAGTIVAPRRRLHRRARYVLVAQLALTAVTWLGCNGPIEGRTLVTLAPHHGITTSDLLVLLPAALGWRLMTRR